MKIIFLIFTIPLIHLIRNLDIIPIAMSLDNNFIYQTIVSIISIIENKNPTTKYIFYIMFPPNFNKENKDKLKSLEKKYKNQCTINLIDMGNRYKNAPTNKKIPTPTYYRLSLPILLPKLEKIIWLDGDTLTHNDLKEMYDINMDNLYFRGFLDYDNNDIDNISIKNDHLICAGVMLINLEELRKDNMIKVFEEFIKVHSELLHKHDQSIINGLCYNKTDILPPKFGIYNWVDKTNKNIFINYNERYHYTNEELDNAIKNPVVSHCTFKPWNSEKFKYADLWWSYAKKSEFYWSIYFKYSKTGKKIKKWYYKLKIIISISIFVFFGYILFFKKFKNFFIYKNKNQ